MSAKLVIKSNCGVLVLYRPDWTRIHSDVLHVDLDMGSPGALSVNVDKDSSWCSVKLLFREILGSILIALIVGANIVLITDFTWNTGQT